MSLYRLLLRSLRRHTQTPPSPSPSPSPALHVLRRSFAFSSAEEAAAERRRRKRRLRIEPPLHALRRDPPTPSRRDPNAPRLPDSTSALVGPRLNLHNRVQSLIRASDLDAASSVARSAVFSNTRPTVFTCNAIIAAMFRARRYSDAAALFSFFFVQSNIVPNIVSYNNLINTHCDNHRIDEALEVYRHIMANAPFSPSPVTYRHLTKGLVDHRRIGEAVDLLREMLNKGHGADSLVYNNLIAGFLKLDNLDKANELFDELKERCLVYDGVVNATFMEWFFGKGMKKEAMESYRSLLDRQFKMIPATCNVLIEVLLRHEKKVEAWALFDQMLDNHTPPNFQAVNSETFNIMVNDCFRYWKIEKAVATFRKVGTKANSRPFAMDVAGYNNIITKYCENAMLPEAEAMFAELCSKSLSPDVNSHRALIDAYLRLGRIDDAAKMLSRMVEAGLWLVASYGLKVFDQLIGNGRAIDCARVLRKLGEKDPKPDASLYEVVVKGLCNEGSYEPSRDLIEEMMRYNVCVTPELRQFVQEAFGKAGRGGEIESVLSSNVYGSSPSSEMARPRQQQPRGPGHQMPNHSLGSPQRSGFHGPPSGPPQMAASHQAWPGPPGTAPPPQQNNYSAPPHQMVGSQQNMARPHYNPHSESPQVAQPWHHHPETRHQMMGPGQSPPRPPHIGGPHQEAGFQHHPPAGQTQPTGQYNPMQTYRPPPGSYETEGSYQPQSESRQVSGGEDFVQNRATAGWQSRY